MYCYFSLCVKIIATVALMCLLTVATLQGQEQLNSELKKGSYLYYGNLAFEDNSFLLTEAFTQEKGVMQYISNFYWSDLNSDQFTYSFTHEIPLGHNRHQFSYTFQSQDDNVNHRRLGDTNVMYSYSIWGERDWMMIVPELNIILPTGDPAKGLGNGGFGYKLNVPITKRISRKVVSHYNFAYTIIHSADRYITGLSGENIKAFEKNLHYKDLAASIIWYPVRKFNIIIECVSKFITNISAEGSIVKSSQMVLNPGFRLAFDLDNIQVVPGFSMPVIFENGGHLPGIFFYLSFEPDYLLANRMK